MEPLLNQIEQPNDIKKLKPSEYRSLAKEIRRFLVRHVAEKGGHLASNLGAVELTMALHLFLDFPADKLIWDVGHQAYVHKLLTGRKEAFERLREQGGLSGFPKRRESDCDAFDTGHSSTSVSAAAGFVHARELSEEDYKVVAVIGDGALTGGMAFEALNNLGKLKSNLIIVLNDNHMSISENVGGMANYLAKIRTSSAYTGFKGGLEEALNKVSGVGEKLLHRLKRSKDSLKYLFISGMLFEDMGLTYIGPIDGHDVLKMLEAFETASRAKKAVLIHVVTKKGKGYAPAEDNPGRFHGVEPFSLKSGKSLKVADELTYTEVFSKTMTELGEENKKLLAITAAMPSGTGLQAFAERYPERFFDVGIAEEHAVTFAAGLAAGGYHPVVAIYSTFLQRAYDQILHDVCLGSLPVTFAVDRAGIVGKDGETHQGIFDLSYLSHIPNLTLMAPRSAEELRSMLHFAVSCSYPTAVRYPRGAANDSKELPVAKIEQGKAELLYQGNDVLVAAVGTTVTLALSLREKLLGYGIEAGVLNVRFISPMDTEQIAELAKKAKLFVTIEENIKAGGFGEKAAVFLAEQGIGTRHKIVALSDCFIEQGEQAELREQYGLSEDGILQEILLFFGKK